MWEGYCREPIRNLEKCIKLRLSKRPCSSNCVGQMGRGRLLLSQPNILLRVLFGFHLNVSSALSTSRHHLGSLLVSWLQIHLTAVARIWRWGDLPKLQSKPLRPPRPPRPLSPDECLATSPTPGSYWCSLQWDNSHCWKLHCRRKQCSEGFPNLGPLRWVTPGFQVSSKWQILPEVSTLL